MKIGLDSNLKEFSKDIVTKLKEENLFLIDMYIEKRKNEGYEIYKRVMEANASRLDLFIGIYIEDDKNELTIYYDETSKSKYVASNIYDGLREAFGNEKLFLREGKDFYVLKEIKAPALILKGSLKCETEKLNGCMRTIIKSIFKMESYFK